MVHKRNRYEALCRLLAVSESLGHHLPANAQLRFPTWAQQCELRICRRPLVPAATGVYFLDFVQDVQARMKKDPGYFKSLVVSGCRALPAPALQL